MKIFLDLRRTHEQTQLQVCLPHPIKVFCTCMPLRGALGFCWIDALLNGVPLANFIEPRTVALLHKWEHVDTVLIPKRNQTKVDPSLQPILHCRVTHQSTTSRKGYRICIPPFALIVRDNTPQCLQSWVALRAAASGPRLLSMLPSSGVKLPSEVDDSLQHSGSRRTAFCPCSQVLMVSLPDVFQQYPSGACLP